MTMRQAKDAARELGCTLRRTQWGDIRVNVRGGSEETAYYTDNLGDAVETAAHMGAK